MIGITGVLVILIACVAASIAVMAAYWASRPARGLLAYAGFLLFATAMVHVGFFLLYTTTTAPWGINALLASSLALISVSVGGWIAGHSMGSETIGTSRAGTPRHPPFLASLLVGSVVAVISVYPLLTRGVIPLTAGISQLLDQGFTAGLLNTLRVSQSPYIYGEATYLPLQGLFDVLRYVGLPIVALIFVDHFSAGRHRAMSIVAVATALLCIALTGQRWPVMLALLAIYVHHVRVSHAVPTRPRQLLIVVGVTLVIIIAMSALLGRATVEGTDALGAVLTGTGELLSRLATGNALLPFEAYRLFPEAHGFLGGSSWLQNLIAYLPGETVSYPVTYYQLVSGDSAGFTAPPDFVTEAYINFGWVGVVVLSVAWGVGLVAIDTRLNRYRSQSWIGAGTSVLVVMVALTSVTGMSIVLGAVVAAVLVVVAGSIASAAGRRAKVDPTSPASTSDGAVCRNVTR